MLKRLFSWLGDRDCRLGIQARFNNKYYLLAYGKRYEFDELKGYYWRE